MFFILVVPLSAQNWLGSLATWWKIQIEEQNPGLRPDGTPCISRVAVMKLMAYK